ncbi:VanW family protein [Cohnella cellulosilytica]|uniref:VanW family protein n=1 Tax=Cohnella cellulosilytica TaxID=986710 RepID=A0ABW2FKC2_9BACL
MKKAGWIILVMLLLIGAGVGGAMSYGSDESLPEGFSVGGLELGGRSPEEALATIRSRLTAMESIAVSLDPDSLGTSSDGSLSASSAGDADIPALTLGELGLRVGADEAIRAIERYKNFSWWERAKRRAYGERGPAFELVRTWDSALLEKAARQAWGALVRERAADASRTIDETDHVVYRAEKMGRGIELSAALRKIESLAPSSLADIDGSVRLVRADIVETPPEITVAKLKEDGLERKIAEFATSFATSGEGRSHNVTAAALALNDTLLQPDEVFEYGKIVAKAEKEYGYMEAPVILNGKLTPGIGGGICQVSSTLYNAALLAGLEIVERRNHSLPVSYLPRGLDATFADGYVNFKFRNSTGKQLLIRTVVADKTVTVKLFGTMDERVSYQTETDQLKINPPKTVYVADPTVALGEQTLLQKGENGYVVEAFLVKLVDGKFAERKRLSKDTYRTQDALIAVHPDDPRLLPPGAGQAPGGPDAGPVPAPDAPAPEETPIPGDGVEDGALVEPV